MRVQSSIPDALSFDSDPLTSDLPLGGSAHLIVRKDGNFTFNCHAHDSGFDNIDYDLFAVLMSTSGIAFTFQHSGHTEGTTAGLPFGTPNRNDDFGIVGINPAIVPEFERLMGRQLQGKLVGKDTLIDGIEAAIGDLVKQLAQELGKEAAVAVIALLGG